MKPIVKGNKIYNWGQIESIEPDIQGKQLIIKMNSGTLKKMGFADNKEMQSYIDNLIKELSQ